MIDSVFNALQEVNLNEKLLASAEATIRACEEELLILKEMDSFRSSWNPLGSSAIASRVGYLLGQMESAEKKRASLETHLGGLKKKLHG